MEDFFKQGLKIALNYLEKGERFEHELSLKLQEKGFNEDTINQIIRFLNEKKILNDEKVLKNVVDYRSNVKREGKFKIIQKLIQRGVDKEKINMALENISAETILFSAILCLEKKFKKDFDKLKAYRFLCGRGYEHTVIEKALNQFEQNL